MYEWMNEFNVTGTQPQFQAEANADDARIAE